MFLSVVCCVLAFSNLCQGLEILSLNGKWILSDSTKKYNSIKALVPGGVYSDLMNSEIIGDIHYGLNDRDLKWVPRLNWTYTRTFILSQNLINNENIHLVFDGLDTFSTIYLNGAKIGESKNMFVQYIFPVKNHLQVGNNTLTINFLSPIEVSSRLATEQAKNYTVPPDCPATEYNGECHVNMVRKMQASFAWDWGPSFPSVGIWKDVYIQAFSESVIRYVVSDVSEQDQDNWNLNLDVYLATNMKNIVSGKILVEIALNFVNFAKVIDVNTTANSNQEIVAAINIPVPKFYVNSWWPNGYGESKLYLLKVTYESSDSKDISIQQQKIGFRKVELVQDKLTNGLSFYFKINDVPIFMKGSNEIPVDILPEKGQNQSTIKRLLTAARDANMNMIRVWGGGVYESDYFYSLADELGILIWQDFMFACGMYPATDIFLDNVLLEVKHQVKRLYSHPSIILFSGNNENEGALRQNWYNTLLNFTIFYQDYVKLYVTTIKSEFLKITHDRGLFITSSPTNGNESDAEGYVAQNPASSLYGDIHFYNYILDPFNPNFYPTPRFASEYGYQSLPSIQSWLSVTNNLSDININSAFMNHRQHHPLGNIQLQMLLLYNFKAPSTNSSYFDEAFIYYSQVVQAMATKIETEHYRIYRSNLNAAGEGHTMGALYWQLNDVWVAPSWSGIDYKGRRKMLQYLAGNFFSPVIVVGHIDSKRDLMIYIVSDLLSPIENVTVSIRVFNWTSFQPIDTTFINVTLENGSSSLVKTIQTDNYLSTLGCGLPKVARNNCFFYLSLANYGVAIAPDNFVLPAAVKYINLTSAEVRVTSVNKLSDKGEFRIEITSDKFALFVWIDSPAVTGIFSENGFLIINTKTEVYFKTEEPTTADDLLKTLTITHILNKNYFSV
uniref:beta-mannosidase n=1 Tax=Diabrotica virgifera virgifera TaxID=50390 RepID=A0A6P7FVN4_DIAVI